MTREVYIESLRDLLSRDPARVREANRRLYAAAVLESPDQVLTTDQEAEGRREADVALADVAT